MSSVAHFLFTLACAALYLLVGLLKGGPLLMAAPLVLAASGYSLLGPAFASRTGGLELAAMYLGTSIAVSILIGTALSRLGIAITSESLFVSYGGLFGFAALFWGVARMVGSADEQGARHRWVPRVRLVGYAAVIAMASAATALLFTAPGREQPVAADLGLFSREPAPALHYKPGETIELEAQIRLPSATLSRPELVVSTNSGQSIVTTLGPELGVQIVSVSLPVPDRSPPILVVTGVVQDSGVAISPEVRLNLRPLEEEP